MQNLRRGHYEIAIDIPPAQQVAASVTTSLGVTFNVDSAPTIRSRPPGGSSVLPPGAFAELAKAV